TCCNRTNGPAGWPRSLTRSPTKFDNTVLGHQLYVGNHAAGHATETAMDEELAVEVAEGWDCAVVTLSGPLSLCTVPQTKVAVGKALASQGCVVVDLSSLRLKWEPGVNVFAT